MDMIFVFMICILTLIPVSLKLSGSFELNWFEALSPGIIYVVAYFGLIAIADKFIFIFSK